MNTTKWIFGVLIIVAIGTLVYTFRPAPQPTTPITIGFIGALSGDAAAYGESSRGGVMLAVEEINAEGGVNGRPLQVVYEDGKCAGKDAASAAQKLVAVDRVKMMVAGPCSGEVFGYAPITNAAKVVTISPYASNPKISELGDYVFRNTPSDSFIGAELARLVARDHKAIAVVSENTEYSQGIREAFAAAFQNQGGRVIGDEVVPPNTTDFRSALTKVLQNKPEALFLNTQAGGGAARMAAQTRELGSNAQFYVVYFTGDDYIASGAAVDGTLFVDTPIVADSSRGATFLRKYTARFGKKPSYPYSAGASYDDVYILRDALILYGEDTEKIRDYLYTLKSYSGVIGTYGFDMNGDVTSLTASFAHLKNGTLQKVLLNEN